MAYCLPLLHLRHQHVSIRPDVDVRTVTLHILDSKLNANPRVEMTKALKIKALTKALTQSEFAETSSGRGVKIVI